MIDVKIARVMLKYIEKVCNRHSGLNIAKYSKLSGEKTYRLEWYDCG